MIENEIASGINASATTSPASNSVRSNRGERKAARTVGSGECDNAVLKDCSVPGAARLRSRSGASVTAVAGRTRSERNADRVVD